MTAEIRMLRPRSLPASTPTGERVQRFTRTERGVHWTHAVSFLVLMITGFALSLSQIEGLIGHRELMREIHLTAALFFAFGPTLVGLAGDRAALREDVETVDTWSRADLLWLLPPWVFRLFGVPRPPQGKFNAGQKLNAVFVAASTLAFVVTGLIIWQNRRFPIDLVARANDIHTLLAYVALLAFLGHLFLATVYPPTRHAFRSITQGWVCTDWALQHHTTWVRSLRAPTAPPPHDALRTTVQIFLGSAIAIFFTRILFFAIGANVTDKVTGRVYDVTAWPGVASVVPATGARVLDTPAIGYLVVLAFLWLAVDRLRVVRVRDSSQRGNWPSRPD